MALLQKQPDAAHDARPAKPWRTAKPPKEWRAFAAELFPALTDAPGRMVGDVWMLLPETPLPETRLHILRAGVPAGRVVKNRFEPAHALFMARGASCPNREELTVADPRTAAWLRGEEIPARTAHNGCRSAAARPAAGGSRTITPKRCGCRGKALNHTHKRDIIKCHAS